jgi:anti-sigma factor ChrR (cupin superfamily)
MSETPGPLLVLRDVFTTIPVDGWQPFRPGVEVRWMYRVDGGSSAALLRYEPGASIPRHEHAGYEHIVVLAGSQSDGYGDYPAGTLIVNRPGSQHRVASPEGCVVFITWERPVRVIDDK